MDSQTRFVSVNASLARESCTTVDNYLGKTSREVVGDIASRIEPTYERVFSTGKSETLEVKGHLRDQSVCGHWLDHCFPILDSCGRVQQMGKFVVNIAAEKSSRDIFDLLSRDSKLLLAKAAGLLDKFDQSITSYHASLEESFKELACPFTETERKMDRFRSSITQLDNEISTMRELTYAVLSHFSFPEC
jgi:hypothetical protein